MKSLLRLPLLLLALLHGQFSQAQGNLQFNQAITLQWTESVPINSNSYYYISPGQPFTVPAGKVWKIESMNVSPDPSNAFIANVTQPTGLLNGPQTSGAALYLNSTVVYTNPDAGLSGASVTGQILWLAPGNYTYRIGAKRSTTAAVNFSGFVTAIEFNVVP